MSASKGLHRLPFRALYQAMTWLALALQPALAHAQGNLCMAEEKVLFSCAIEDRLVSVCAAPNVSAKTGYVQLRYGSPEQIEIELPETRDTRKGIYKGALFFSGYLGAYLRFDIDRTSFIVFNLPGRSSGMVIEKNKAMWGRYMCHGAVISNLKDVPVPIADAFAVTGTN